MKKVCLLMLGLALTGGAAVADELEKGFATPPDAAKNQVWWHWLQGNVTREGITADLEAMKSVGVGGAQIFNLSEELPAGPAPFMSPQWLELVKYAAAEAERLGLELGIQQAGGWSNSGGPWIKPEQAMQMVTISETRQQGPVRFDGPLKQPETRSGKGYENGFYRDIAVLAFPTPHDDKASIERFRQKALFDSQYGQMPQPAALPTEAVIPQGGVINLTEKLAADGRLVWDVPAGDWTILRIGYTLTGAGNVHSPVSGQGLECDKLSAEAFDAHWAGAIEPILQKLGPLVGRGLQNCLIDSYEVGSQNWTPRMREEFRRRCGYDLLPFLPALTGRVVVDSETSERFLWDFRRVQGDLFAENYYMHFSELCRKNGLKSAMEPYDGPFECLQVGAKSDVLMGEFWVKNGREEPGSVKLAASSAHTHGIGIVGVEAFTAMPEDGKWKNHPAQLKRLGDLVWSAGVNRLTIHRYAHQPWLDKFPGMTMGYWGMHFERTVTWWEQSRAWLSYCARSQYLLQQGKFAADVLVFAGEASPNGMVHREDLKSAGYDYDVCSSDLIASLGVKDGCVTTPVGPSKSGPAMSYRLLVMPETTWMSPKVARKIRELVKGGATVLGPKPERSPSLQDFPACDVEVRKIADEVWGMEGLAAAGERAFGAGRVMWNHDARTILAAMVKPDFQAVDGAGIKHIHRSLPEADIYFVSNQEPKGRSVECLFRAVGRQPELWHADTGVIEPASLWCVKDGRTAVTLNLDAEESVFLVFRRPAIAPADPVVAIENTTVPANRPVPKLVINKAIYGALTFEGTKMVDVSDKVRKEVKDGRLIIHLANLGAGDPAWGSPKEIRIAYDLDGKEQMKVGGEGGTAELPQATTGAAPVKFLRAIYGKFDEKQMGVPHAYAVDVTAKLVAQLKDGMLKVTPSKVLGEGDPGVILPKQLRVWCTVDGIPRSITVREDAELCLPRDVTWEIPAPTPRLVTGKGAPRLLAWENGAYLLKTASGTPKTVTVPAVPAVIDLAGPWQLEFKSPVGAPPKTTFDRLISWPDHTDAAIKYFSGTATYRKVFDLPKSTSDSHQSSILLDLGRVEVIAEVKLNGKDLGILWKPPFRVDISEAVRPGANQLEVRVTNLWPNRLIGDEQFQDDCDFDWLIKSWPDWLVKGTPRPSKDRVTFTTLKGYQKDSSLLPSGLLGPVTIRTGAWVEVK
ncbi:MAG: hypothetical protein K9N23_06845 [Akkermansiaceae bacterium]|nr:hypothetical protein [Akkermansiaceae bacterium]